MTDFLHKKFNRTAIVERAAVDTEKRIINLAFSSEEPYERSFGWEILGHQDGEMDTSWLATGRAPVLVDHDVRDHVGVIETVFTGSGDRVGRCQARFGQSARASEIFQDMADGIRVNISVGYEILEAKEIGVRDGIKVYRITKWRPLEVSVVSIPADMTVGVGRDQTTNDQPAAIAAIPKEQVMSEPNIQVIQTEAVAKERSRINEIMAIGTRHQRRELAEKAIRDGNSIEEFRGIMLDAIGSGVMLETPASDLGLSKKETKEYSLTRAILSMATDGDRGRTASFEMECSAEIAKRIGASPRGFFVPLDWQRAKPVMKRDQTVGTATEGGNLVQTTILGSSFIDILRSRMMVTQLGATVLSGLNGNVAIPRKTTASNFAWVAEGAAPSESQMAIGQLTLSPKTAIGFTDFTRQLMLQSSLDVENLVRQDIADGIAVGIDRAALHGTGSGGQPTGLAGTAGIGSVAIGTNGGAPTWGVMVSLESAVANQNADVGSVAYLTNPTMRGRLKQVEKATNTAMFVWENNMTDPGMGMVNGYRAGATTNVRADLTKGSSTDCSAIFFGNWADLVIANWGVLDVLVDPFTQSNTGTVRVNAYQSIDIGIRRAGSFAACLDARNV